MFGYKFGDISKNAYKKVTKTKRTDKTNDASLKTGNINNSRQQNEDSTKKQEHRGYQFGDITKSVYNKCVTDNSYQYQFGDVTRTAYQSMTGYKVEITNAMKEGFLQKKSPLLLTYSKLWVVLQNKFLYIFKNKKQYINCIQIIDLSLYNGVQSISNGYFGEFRLVSPNNDNHQTLLALSEQERTDWIQCIMKVIGVHKVEEMKISQSDECNTANLDLNCIVYYIVDLEYTHSESGDPAVLLRNQNFIISIIIWSYMHEPDKKFDFELVSNLDENQRNALKYWQKPIGIVHGIHGGLKEAIKGTKKGAAEAAFGTALHLVFGGKHAVALLPLCVVAGIGHSAQETHKGFQHGFKKSYHATKN